MKKKKKQKRAAGHRTTFVDAFATYVVPEKKDDAAKANMLKALSEFLTAEGIGMDNIRHFELLAKMTDFAGPVRGGKPRLQGRPPDT